MNNNNSDSIIAIFIIIAAVIGILCWKFSKALGLDIETGAELFIKLIAICIAAGILLYSKLFQITWPFVLAAIWVSFWPAIDHWGVVDYPFSAHFEMEKEWWAEWYTKWIILLAILGGGYLYKYLSKPAYY